MIYADIDKEEVKYEGDGLTLIKETAMVLGTSLIGHIKEKDEPISKEDAINTIHMIAATLDSVLQESVIGALEDVTGEEDEEENFQEERSGEDVPTQIKKFRRPRRS